MLKHTKISDPEVYELTLKELHRQEKNIEMIASESTVPPEIMELQGSVFTNKTLEGYPGSRYQAGSRVADELEDLARKRACELFGADHANLQTYSGSTANYSVFASVLEMGDTILSMSLDQGGHLTHGSPANWTSKMYRHVFYGCDPATGLIDYDEVERLAVECKPKLIICGGSSYPRLIDYERIGAIAKKVGAYSMCDMAHVAGLIAAKVIPSPFPYMDFVSSSTTKTFCSARSGMVFCKKEFAKLLDKGTFPGSMGSTHFHAIAAKCWSFKYAATPEFRAIMQGIVDNSRWFAECLKEEGFDLVAGGSDNHMVVVDLRNKGVTGRTMHESLDEAGITVSKQIIPGDTAKPWITSGIRIGLAAVTQRGFSKDELKTVAHLIAKVAADPENKDNLAQVRAEAEAISARHPLYPAGTFDD